LKSVKYSWSYGLNKVCDRVLSWPISRNIKKVQKFLELANYYRQFIKDFVKLTAPLHVLVKKEKKWRWEKVQEKVFRKLKKAFTTELVLAIPDLDKKMQVEVNVSDYATGEMLLTKYRNRK